jgi:antitoxin ParD1/3/4
VIREALRDWKMKRELQLQKMAVLRAEIGRGLEDVAEGRTVDFSTSRIVQRGRKLSAERSRSA